MCEVITERDPGLDRGRERHQLAGRAASRRSASTVGSSRWLSWAVSPCPGKCLAQAATPGLLEPVDPGGDVRGDPGRVGAEAAGADDRVVRVAVDVGDRAEVEVDADRGQLGADRRDRSRGSGRGRRRRRARPARAPGCRSRACSRVTSPPSSSTAMTAYGATARIARGQRRRRRPGRRRCCCRRGRPRRGPRRTARPSRAGSVVPGNAGEQHPQGEAAPGWLIPSPPGS